LVADDIVRDLEVMNKAHQTQPHQRALLSVARSLDSMTRWILEHRTDALTWHELVARFKEPFHVLIKKTESFLSEIELSRFQESRKKLVESGFSHEHASMVAALVYSASFLDIVEISRHQGEEVVEVAKLYDALASEFQLTHLLEKIVGFEVSDRWEALAVRTMTAQLRGSVGQMTRRVISELGAPTLDSMGQYLESRSEMVTRFRLSLREFQHKNLTIPALMVITNQLTALSRGAK